jgi:hypothetical protein
MCTGDGCQNRRCVGFVLGGRRRSFHRVLKGLCHVPWHYGEEAVSGSEAVVIVADLPSEMMMHGRICL